MMRTFAGRSDIDATPVDRNQPQTERPRLILGLVPTDEGRALAALDRDDAISRSENFPMRDRVQGTCAFIVNH